MPFKVKKSGKGYKVFSPHGAKSKKPMSKEKARKQQAAIYANWSGESLEKKLDRVLIHGETPPEPIAECMDHDELLQRAAAFRKSIARGLITPEEVEKSMLGWIKSDFITLEQAHELIEIVKQQ